ncbi:hypothetical protein GGI25_000949 [Coemansia spiralis]|uniref:Protein kinase domain-containing protein n=2 Tax=Coemansia TaxID=4863 RepID=A0A9W8L0H9_9FUNG|nr:hypothetical protein BX070DRAFT_250457 [Coemansia spiralis]KAJ1993808.1 hypothetical protein EDC05_001968 [Coemansia umbellata]KAJ2623184.1 hypothetical protein GGI26_002598 [Coemansia sp. RSA 1358]KAJ2680061.1 hypothetical protein GGI25_000949 [Coemansia spiralis]
MEHSNPNSSGSCYRHRRNSDVFLEKTLSRHSSLSDGDASSEDDDEASSGSSFSVSCRVSSKEQLCSHANGREDTRYITGASDSNDESSSASGCNGIRTAQMLECNRDSPRAAVGQHCLPLKRGKHRPLSRNHSSSMHYHHHYYRANSGLVSAATHEINLPAARVSNSEVTSPSHLNKNTATAYIHESIRSNTQDVPMSSAKALHIFDTVFASGSGPSGKGEETAEETKQQFMEHDSSMSCKHCAFEEMVISHEAAAKGVVAQHGGHTELRMNLGNGRNAIYVAPCERHLECPLDRMGKYLIHTNKSKIMTDMSKVEFGIRVDGWKRVVFKTVNDPELSERELHFHRKVAAITHSEHLVQLLDDFTDNSNKHVMVFPRMNTAEIYGHELYDIAYIARQLFTALEDLHALGIAHLDITPTNLMSDPNDTSHVEVIDFGLACDISTAKNGYLPSRGTCGFVAPEVLSGQSRDLRADIYSAGVVVGMMLQKYLPAVNLRLLGGPLVRSDTTDMIITQLDALLEAYKYEPEPVSFIYCNTTYVQPQPYSFVTNSPAVCSSAASGRTCTTNSQTVVQPLSHSPTSSNALRKDARSRCSHNYSDKDNEAAAFAAAYTGEASLFGGYSSFSDDDNDETSTSERWGTNNCSTYYDRRSNGVSINGRTDCTGPHSERLSSYINSSGPESGYVGSECDSGCNGKYYTSSPNNTPVYSRSFNGSKPYHLPETSSLDEILGNTSHSSSNIRYANNAPSVARHSLPIGSSGLGPSSSYRTASIRQSISIQSSSSSTTNESNCNYHVKRPGRVPVAVLHAADLLRWVLQANPQCRPTALQALEHPFLAFIEIKSHKRRLSSNDSPASLTGSPEETSGISSSDNFNLPQQEKTHYFNRKLKSKQNVFNSLRGHSAAAPHLNGTDHSDSGVASEHTSCIGSPVLPEHSCSPYTVAPTNAKDSTDTSAVAYNVAQRDKGMFKNSAQKDIRLWESEMHSRLSHYSPMYGDRGIDHESSYSNSSYDHVRDEVNNFYSNNYNDITSYFY